jgi:hypothetical protein
LRVGCGTHFKHTAEFFYGALLLLGLGLGGWHNFATTKCFRIVGNTTGIATTKRLAFFTLVLVTERFHRLAKLASVLFHIRFAPCDP